MPAIRRSAVAAATLLVAVIAAVVVWECPPNGERAVLATEGSTTPIADSPAPHLPSTADDARPRTTATQISSQAGAASAAPIGADAAIDDYGQFVLTALNGGTPQQAGQAARLISQCRLTERTRQAMEMLKSDGRFKPEQANQIIDQADQEGRLCQSLTEDMKRHRADLAERAILGGVKGLGKTYGDAIGYAPSEAMRQPLLNALRVDFLDGGDPYSALMLARFGEALGLSSVDRAAYLDAFEALSPIKYRDLYGKDEGEAPGASLTEEERRRVAALAAEWVHHVQQAKQPPRG